MRSRCNGAVQHSFALFVLPAYGRRYCVKHRWWVLGAVYELTVNTLQLVMVLARVRGACAALRKVENRVVRTAKEWYGHKRIGYIADELFAMPGFVSAVHVSMLSVVKCVRIEHVVRVCMKSRDHTAPCISFRWPSA